MSTTCQICNGIGAVKNIRNESEEFDCLACNGEGLVCNAPDDCFTSHECLTCEIQNCPHN